MRKSYIKLELLIVEHMCIPNLENQHLELIPRRYVWTVVNCHMWSIDHSLETEIDGLCGIMAEIQCKKKI